MIKSLSHYTFAHKQTSRFPHVSLLHNLRIIGTQTRLTSTIVNILLLIMSVPHHLNDRTTRAPINAAAVTQTSTIATTIRRDGILLPHTKAYLRRSDKKQNSCDSIDEEGATVTNVDKNETDDISTKTNDCPNDTSMFVRTGRVICSDEGLFHPLQ